MVYKFVTLIKIKYIFTLTMKSAKYVGIRSLFCLKNFLYLLYRALCLEENASAQKFCEYAANRPDINGRCVVLGAHQ